MTIKLIVGLRNPGAAYKDTRHNAGGWFLEALAAHYQVNFKSDKKMHGELANIEIGGVTCRLLLPLVFMNHSGLAVQAVSSFYGIEPQDILVVHDELDLPVSRIKLKTGGGHGGHNGLRDIIHQLGSAFHRLRVGIGHPGHKELVLDYVLGKPSQSDRKQINEAIGRGIDILPTALSERVEVAMSQLNGEGT